MESFPPLQVHYSSKPPCGVLYLNGSTLPASGVRTTLQWSRVTCAKCRQVRPMKRYRILREKEDSR